MAAPLLQPPKGVIKMSSATISTSYIDRSLISGSFDYLRASLERSWEVVTNEITGETLLEFNGNDDFEEGISHFLSEIQENTDLRTEADEKVLVPNYVMPIRLIGNPDQVSSDLHWKALVAGGSYASIRHTGFYQKYAFTDTYHESQRPYGGYETAVMSQYADVDFVHTEILPSYNFFIPKYQTSIRRWPEPALPNLYIYDVIVNSDSESVSDNIPSEILTLVTQDDTIEENIGLADITNILNPTRDAKMPPWESLYDGVDLDGDGKDDMMFDRNFIFRDYLSASFATMADGAQYVSTGAGLQNNIYFDDSAATQYLKSNSSVLRRKKLFPMYVGLKIPVAYDHPQGSSADERGIFRNIFKHQNSVQILLTSLQESLNQGGGNRSPTIREEYYQADEESGTLNFIKDSAAKSSGVRTITLNGLLSKMMENYNAPDNSYFAGELNFNRIAALDLSKSYYRFHNHSAAVKTTTEITKYLHDNYPAEQFETLNEFLEQANVSKYHETIAYKIEKWNGDAIAQTFWIFNDSDLGSELNFIDTQVKYDSNYTYNVYRYKIVIGYRYRYSDLVITRQFADEMLSDEGDTKYCLEFYNPTTDNASDQLLEESDELSDENEFIDSNAQITDENQYLADFRFAWEPHPVIVETLIASKKINIIDNPAHTLNVAPYQLKDDPQIVGFEIKVNAFQKTKVPDTLSESDEHLIPRYKDSYNILEGDLVSDASRSSARAIQVYRTTEKPESYDDFGPVPFKEYDLSIIEPKLIQKYYSMVQCYDRLNINVKYYYMFRAINANNVPGPSSEIYEAELKKDAQHVYASFNILNKSDLEKDMTYTQPSVSMKKLFMIAPNQAQKQLNTNDVDWAEPAHSQMENLSIGMPDLKDPIWNKEFKIRLTSKKTGKKIDLNITYKVESE